MTAEEKKQLNMLVNPEKSIPKFATGMAVNKIENGDLLISFYNQAPQPQSQPPLVLIETLIITEAHAKKIIEVYQELGLRLEPANNAIMAGITEVHNRLMTDRLKVFSDCHNWREEYRIYRYKDNLPAPKQRDHAMDSTRYGVMSGMQVAITEPLYDDNHEYQHYEEQGRSKVGGY